MEMIEPLPDFQLFCVRANTGRFIRGFGQAYELEGEKLEQLTHVGPGQ
jgi:putative heme iron utilization protein